MTVSGICAECGREFRAQRSRDRSNLFCGSPCWQVARRKLPSTATPHSIRRLRDDEPVPEGTPRRYRDAHGYIVLRWHVGVRSYVERLEHRLVAGVEHPHVHHVNRVKDDNRPENLMPLSSLEHGAQHSKIDVDEAIRLYAEGWSLPRLGQRYGVHSSNVLRALRRRGVKMRTIRESWVIRKAS